MKIIKKQCFLVFLCLILMPCAIKAQVGINVEDIKGILHIDAAHDNASTVTPSQEANDMVVTTDGNVGVGTISPTARLHLKSESPYSAFRLQTEVSEGTVLLGDSDGYASWGVTKGNGGQQFSFAPVATSFPYGQTKRILLDTEYDNGIRVKSDGSYAILLRWAPALRYTSKVRRAIQIRYELKRKRVGVSVDVVCQSIIDAPFVETNQFASLFMSFIAQNVLKGDILYIDITLIGGGTTDYLNIDRTWTGSAFSAKAFDSQSVIFYKL